MGAEVYISTNGINTNSKFFITTGNAIVLVTKNRNKNQNLIIHATNCPKKLIALFDDFFTEYNSSNVRVVVKDVMKDNNIA